EEAGPHAAAALAKLGPDAAAALPALSDALQRSGVRPYAAQALAQLGAAGALAKAMGDRDEDVRVEVVLALRLLGRKGVPVLAAALRDRSSEVRVNVAATLEKLGPEAKEAVGEL